MSSMPLGSSLDHGGRTVQCADSGGGARMQQQAGACRLQQEPQMASQLPSRGIHIMAGLRAARPTVSCRLLRWCWIQHNCRILLFPLRS